VDRTLQEQLVVEINKLMDHQTTAMAGTEMHHPVREYYDRDRLEQERSVLFRQHPVVMGHGSQLPTPGDYLTDDLAGVPVLVVRQADGSVRAFLNVCRHRASKVTFEEQGHARVLTCPYHAWSYDTDGRLRSIPYDDGFTGVPRDRYGLVELPAEERHGLVWVVPTPGAAIDVAAYLGPLDQELASYGLDAYVHERSTVLRDDLNWKLVVDGFLETYHLRFLHGKTVGPYLKTNLTPFEVMGRHGRMVGVRASFDTVRDLPPSQIDLLPHIAVIYQLFPNTVLVWQADHFECWTCFPDGDDPARSASRVSLLAPRPTSSAEEQARWDRNWKILMDTVLYEDFLVARAMQKAFASGAVAHSLFGRNEPALQHFHRQLAEVLGPADG
jgi:nitrite reductase/ring-hydroxylating ferredoxin subunit